MSYSSNDNVTQDADAHGQAALLLVESLIHGLIEQSHITVANATEIIDVAADVAKSMAEGMGRGSATIHRSVTLLDAMSLSLSRDLPNT